MISSATRSKIGNSPQPAPPRGCAVVNAFSFHFLNTDKISLRPAAIREKLAREGPRLPEQSARGLADKLVNSSLFRGAGHSEQIRSVKEWLTVSGPRCEPANPNRVSPDSGLGFREKSFFNLSSSQREAIHNMFHNSVGV